MMVTLIAHDPCGVCGYRRKGFMFPSMRVNKRSMRSTGTYLTVQPGWCEECGRYTGSAPSLRWVLDPQDAARVEAYRLGRWPELATERAAASRGAA